MGTLGVSAASALGTDMGQIASAALALHSRRRRLDPLDAVANG